MYVTELSEPQLLVIYPGRFQPFHKGHYEVYQYLSSKYGRNNVYIATSNKVESPKSPFTFSEKAYFMQLTGVPTDRILQTASPYNIEDIQAAGVTIADPTNTVVMFAVSKKDMAEDPRFKSWTKKDGNPTYFQPLTNLKDTKSMQEHGYILTVPTFDFKVAGQPMQSGTELRDMYTNADEKQRQAIVADLFGRYTHEAEQIMTNKLAPAQPKVPERPTKLPKTSKPAGGLEPVAESEERIDPARYQLLRKAHLAHPAANSDAEALALYLNDKEEQDINNVEYEEHDLETRVQRLEQEFAKLASHRLSETGGVGVVKGGNDPRYCMATAGDQNAVNGETLGKEMRAFGLTGRKAPKAPEQRPVKSNVGKGVKETREPYQSAIDRLEARRIEQLNDLMDEIKDRIGSEPLPAKYVEELKRRFDTLKAERDSYYKINTR